MILSSNISIDVSYVIHPKCIYFLNHFIDFSIRFLHDRSRSSAVHIRMGVVRNDSPNSFKKDEKRDDIELKY
jgi:hypothetical protein